MRGILTGKRGMAPALLVVVIAWALLAVLLLTGTLVAAHRVDADVAIIRPEVNDIGTDTRGITRAAKTTRITKRISDSVVTASGLLDDTLIAARAIDSRTRSILTSATAINNTAEAIHGNVLAIDNTVNAIDGNVRAINANADSINANARAINANADSINASVRGINADAGSISTSVGGIFDRLSTTLTTVGSIDAGVAGINQRASAARGVVRPIGDDLSAVLQTAIAIDSHATSIDCANLIQGSACPTTTPTSGRYRSPLVRVLGGVVRDRHKGGKRRPGANSLTPLLEQIFSTRNP